ncbi:hypothetical protein [Euzebya rosea]|uniref:hypothetical protein n=1 Tax=Euzebya rosea TaxID=2052804 RepID=UPI0013002A27|nr:hypothetical protein [Euzebya rosea]
MFDRDDVAGVATLLRHTLARHLPGRHPEHRALLTRYRTDAGFRDLTEVMANGLGLDVLDVSDLSGLVLAPQPNSPFTVSVGDLTGDSRGAGDRLLYGLAWLGVATYCYPSPARLDDDREEVFTRDALSAHITDQCRVLESDWDGVDVDEEHLRTAWRLWLQKDPVNPTASGGQKKFGSRAWYLDQTIGLLAANHLIRETGVAGQYRTTARFRVQLREAGDSLALSLFRSATRPTDRSTTP